jgi:hypothetical protein
MIAETSLDDINHSVGEYPESLLERNLIREYLQEKGYTLEDLAALPKEEAKKLMIEACQYAALKLTEVESRARFERGIRGICHSLTETGL